MSALLPNLMYLSGCPNAPPPPSHMAVPPSTSMTTCFETDSSTLEQCFPNLYCSCRCWSTSRSNKWKDNFDHEKRGEMCLPLNNNQGYHIVYVYLSLQKNHPTLQHSWTSVMVNFNILTWADGIYKWESFIERQNVSLCLSLSQHSPHLRKI